VKRGKMEGRKNEGGKKEREGGKKERRTEGRKLRHSPLTTLLPNSYTSSHSLNEVPSPCTHPPASLLAN